MQCATHPSVETQLSCNRCAKAICFRCMVQTPVGSRCADCAKVRPNPLLVLSRVQLAKALWAAIGMAAVGGVGWALVNGLQFAGGFIQIAAAAGIGYGIGELVWRAGNHKHARLLQVMAGVSAALAYCIGNVLTHFWWSQVAFSESLLHFYADTYRGGLFGGAYGITVWGLLSAILSVAVAASKVR